MVALPGPTHDRGKDAEDDDRDQRHGQQPQEELEGDRMVGAAEEVGNHAHQTHEVGDRFRGDRTFSRIGHATFRRDR